MILLACEKVSLGYGSGVVVKDLSFKVSAGEVGYLLQQTQIQKDFGNFPAVSNSVFYWQGRCVRREKFCYLMNQLPY